MIKPGMYISDRYEVIDKVGSGGMADVYKALDHKLNRYVAVKVLKQEFSTDESFVDKFRAEAQSAAGLSHPNIVNVYDVGEENGTYFIVMELIEGITLKSFIERKGRLEIREATGIAIQIAQGLEAAHTNNIIHRDIKPQNIIISKEGKVKVADFGIAKAASSNTLTSSAMGSVHYISPEQARGGYSDEKSDIYSLGVTIYEMILGRVPFEGDNAVNIALLHIQEEPRTLGELVQGVPISSDKIVQKCLQKKAERRYNSVVELIDDLKRSLIEPDVDFVVIPDVLNNSPTIALSPDDVNAIRSGALQAELNNASNMMNVNNGMNNVPQNMNYNNNYHEYNNNNNNDVAYDSASISELERFDDSYEDEEEKVDNKLEKITIIGAVIIVILILGIIGFIISDNISGGKKDKKQEQQTQEQDPLEDKLAGKKFLVEVKDMTEEEAKEKLKADGFENIEVEYYDVPNVEDGVVFNQDPLGGGDERISTDTKITLYVKKTGEKKLNGEESKQIPDSVIGKTPEEAVKDIKDLFDDVSGLQFKLEKGEDPSGNVEEGKVYATSPDVGKTIKNTDTVVIFVNKKSSLVKVPNLIGRTKQQAAQILLREGLQLDTSDIQYDENNTSVNVDCVCSQMPNKGSNVERGTKVKIVLRKEKEEPKKKNYEVTVTLKGSQATNPLSEPVGEEPSVGNLTCKLNLNGNTYNAKEGGQPIDYTTFTSSNYSFTFEVNDYEGDLSSIPASSIDYSVSGGDDIIANDTNTSISVRQR